MVIKCLTSWLTSKNSNDRIPLIIRDIFELQKFVIAQNVFSKELKVIKTRISSIFILYEFRFPPDDDQDSIRFLLSSNLNANRRKDMRHIEQINRMLLWLLSTKYSLTFYENLLYPFRWVDTVVHVASGRFKII